MAIEYEELSLITLPSKYRRPKKAWWLFSILATIAGIAVAVINTFHIIIFGRVMLDTAYLALLVALFLPMVFIWTPASKKAPKDRIPWYDLVLICLSFGISFLFFIMAEEMNIGWAVRAPLYITAIAAVFWVLLIEAGRRTVDKIFAIVVGIVSLYPLYAFLLPGLLSASRFSLVRTINSHILSNQGIWGIPIKVYGGILIGFMIFSLAIKAVGAGRLFNELAIALLGKTRGGPAKVSIVASGFFGSISGSPIANVLTTGCFTIPAMKKVGFAPTFAGAVEATASTGGSLMPPIMGSAAFIMAEILQIPYAAVALAAFIPSILYYLTLFFHIDAYSARHGIKAVRIITTGRPVWKILLDNMHILLGFAVLIYLLFGLYWVQWSPWISTAVVFALAMARKRTRLSFKAFLQFIEETGRDLADLAGILLAVGLIIGAFIITGVAFSLPYSMVAAAGGNVYLVLLLGALAGFILGMGVPITATYIFLAIVLVPGLIEAGLDPLAVHLFAMYVAMISFITPPVALAAFTASVLAGSDAMETGFKACRIGIALFLLPFFFVLSPAMILRGAPALILQDTLTCALGLALLSGSLEGYFWRIGTIKMPVRLILFAGGLLLAMPGTTTDLVGAGITVVVVGACLLNKSWKRVPGGAT